MFCSFLSSFVAMNCLCFSATLSAFVCFRACRLATVYSAHSLASHSGRLALLFGALRFGLALLASNASAKCEECFIVMRVLLIRFLHFSQDLLCDSYGFPLSFCRFMSFYHFRQTAYCRFCRSPYKGEQTTTVQTDTST